ncbi:MAG: hypothetical protein DRH90_18335, partial [Deltaproteobacteria bacterium]
EIYTYPDESGIFSELGYSANMPLKGTIMIDPETEPLKILSDPYVSGAFGWWGTGVIMFENQGYSWLDTCSPYLLIVNYSLDHQIDITTKQGSLEDNSLVSSVLQKITLRNDGLDASMPSDLNVGSFSDYFVKIENNGTSSWFKAKIVSIEKAEEIITADSAEDIVAKECPCEDDWKNHGAYVRCVAQSAKGLVEKGLISKKKQGDIVSEAAKSKCGKKK